MSGATYLDVTDLIEFLQRRESVSGVQRVIAETAPLLMCDPDHAMTPILLDRTRGVFVALTDDEAATLIRAGARSESAADRDQLAATASSCIARAASAQPVYFDHESVIVYLGAVWISDALMMAAREAHAQGARSVFLLYDLTPVLETGHTAAVNRLFERYLGLLLDTASAVPSISASSRRDLEAYAHGRDIPPGTVTELPCGITPDQHPDGGSPWPRPHALFVGTVEARKRHELALRTWQQLIEHHGADNVPDLVCIGRLGWHAADFLDAYVASNGLDGKVSVLSTSVSDAELADFYRHAQFTVYPSRYEGWGLPVSESLAFGKVPVVSRNSSIPEAGGEWAVYVDGDDAAEFARIIDEEVLDSQRRSFHEERIRDGFVDRTWQQVADAIVHDIAQARSQEGRSAVNPQVELGREYMLSVGGQAPDSGYADQYLQHLHDDRTSPLLGQMRRDDDLATVDRALIGTFGSPQTWGYELRPGRHADLRITRPVSGPLVVLFSTRSMPGVVRIDAAGPGGPVNEEIYLGSVVTLPLGDGKAGEAAQVRLTVTDAQDSIEGFMGLRSFVVLRADDLQTQVIAHKAAAQALRQELDFIQGTRSWKVTAPLRKWKGRGA